MVGTSGEREELRSSGEAAGLVIDGEFDTLAEARAADADVDGILVAATRPGAAETELVEALTHREIEVLELLAEGLSNKGIAARLDISDQTVKFHVSAICGKLGAANRTDAVRLGVRRGLIAL